MPVKDHLEMLSSQYLVSALRDDHPAHESVTRPARRRDKKQTLRSRHYDDVSSNLVNGSLPAGAYPETKRLLHTQFVNKAIESQGNNLVLGIPSPDVDQSESQLPRHHRTTLSQLRSGYCTKLRGYQHRVGRADSPTCQHCNNDEYESVHHIFNCPSNPTDLSVIDLWHRPVQVATHLSDHPSFGLPPPPPLPRPPLRPPPEPPP